MLFEELLNYWNKDIEFDSHFHPKKISEGAGLILCSRYVQGCTNNWIKNINKKGI